MTPILDALVFCARGLKSALPRQSLRAIREESLAGYRPGGYNPVRLGDSFNDGRYKIVNKLGYSPDSTFWLARDHETKRHVGLKIFTADSFRAGSGTFELDILRHLKARTVSPQPHILGLLDEFEHRGPNGNHACVVFKAMGPNLIRFREKYLYLELPTLLLKRFSKQLLLALSHLHDACQVIHGDIKPANILIECPVIDSMLEQSHSLMFEPFRSPPPPPHDFYMKSEWGSCYPPPQSLASTQLSVRLADFGASSWFDRRLEKRAIVESDSTQAPEIRPGYKWDHKVDIYALGKILKSLAKFRLRDTDMWAPHETDRMDFLEFTEAMTNWEPKKRPEARTLLEYNWIRNA